MAKIKQVVARQIIDSRGFPTVESTVILDDGLSSAASVPSGASTGIHEALELRDNDPGNYFGKSVLKAVSNVSNKIHPLLKGIEITDQENIDNLMCENDATPNKSNFGANAILSVSLATARCAAAEMKKPLYEYIQKLYTGKPGQGEVKPLFNVINGGLHAARSVSFQEFFIIPQFDSFKLCLKTGCEIYQQLKKELKVRDKNTNIGDEGGFAPFFRQNEEVLEFLAEVTKSQPVKLGLDIASSTFFQNGHYMPQNKEVTSLEYIDFISRFVTDFGLEILEDPLSQDSWSDWVDLMEKVAGKTKIIGDDLLVTNPERLKKAIDLKACNGILIKLNQIGTLSETLNVIKIARDAGFTIIISHRSGETTDDFIADLAVGVEAEYVKFGAPVRGERVAKYNRLLAIYDNFS